MNESYHVSGQSSFREFSWDKGDLFSSPVLRVLSCLMGQTHVGFKVSDLAEAGNA